MSTQYGVPIFAIIDQLLATWLELVDGPPHARGHHRIGFLALQDRAEAFAPQFLERIAAHLDKGRIDPLHEPIWPGHDEALGGHLLSLILDRAQDRRLQPAEGAGEPDGTPASRMAVPTSCSSGHELPEFLVEFQDQLEIFPLARGHGARDIESGPVLKKFVNHGLEKGATNPDTSSPGEWMRI